jgi:heterotetrameric sarcosine oxidase gamma subunit
VPENPAVDAPVARSPVRVADPVEIRGGWAVSAARSTAALRLADRTPLAKVLVRAAPDGPVAARLGVPNGRAARDAHGTLVVGSGPGDWLLIGAPGSAAEMAGRVQARPVEADAAGLVSVLDYTHGRALMRLSGPAAGETLAKLCPIDLADRTTPDGTAFRSSVARLATDVVRDDVAGTRSYLVHCERSSGQYLFDALLDAGDEFGIEPDGFDYP